MSKKEEVLNTYKENVFKGELPLGFLYLTAHAIDINDSKAIEKIMADKDGYYPLFNFHRPISKLITPIVPHE